MKKKIVLTLAGLTLMLALSACGVVGQQLSDKANEERLLKPGALDLPLTGVNDTYQYKFLDKYRITHQWPRISNCKYRALPTLNVKDGSRGEFWAVPDIYEVDGHTWQLGDKKPYFDRYMRHYEVVSSVYDPASLGVGADGRYDANRKRKIGETVAAYEPQSLCFESWYATSHSLVMRLHKRDQETWKAQLTQFNPKGKWSEQRVAGNVWAVQEVPEQELSPRAPGAAGGWFQSWLLPIGDTGYTISLQLGASQESMQYPQAHARMKTMFRQLIESVRIEPLQP